MAITGSFPGMVSSNVVGSTYQNMTPEAERRMYELEDERKRKREEANASIRAQRNAQQQAAQEAQQKGQVWQAFQKMYGPQLQNVYHDTMVQREGVSGPMGIPSKGPAGFTGSPFSSNVPFGSTAVPGQRGSVAPYRMPEAQLNQMLTNMWQQQTDPYMRVAGQMSGSMPKPPGWIYGGGGGSGKKSTTRGREGEQEAEGIDWWKKQNQGGALLR